MDRPYVGHERMKATEHQAGAGTAVGALGALGASGLGAGELFGAVLDAMADAVLIAETERRTLVYGNAAGHELLGRSRDELVGLPIAAIHPPADLPFVEGEFRQQAAGDKTVSLDIPVLRADGSIVACDVNSAPVVVGGETYLVGVFRRQPDRAAIERALRRSEAHHRDLFEHTPVPLIEVDVRRAEERLAELRRQGAGDLGALAGRPDELAQLRALVAVTMVNSAALRLLGLPDARPDTWQALSRLNRASDLTGPALLAMLDGAASFEAEGVLFALDGRPVRVFVQCTRVPGSAGAHGLLLSLTDVGPLRQAEERLAMLVERMPVGCIVTDADRKAVLWNPAAERIFGYSAAEALGKGPEDILVPPERLAELATVDAELRAGESVVRRVDASIAKDGRRLLCEWLTTPLFDRGGALAGTLSMVQDVTERQRAHEAAQASAERHRALLAVSQASHTSIEATAGVVLEQALGLTHGSAGLVATLDEDEAVCTVHAIVAPGRGVATAMSSLAVKDAGKLGECVRLRRPVVVNGGLGAESCMPPGHLAIERLLCVPLFDGERIVALGAVANKASDYTDADVGELTVLMEGMWRHLLLRRTSEQLARAQRIESLALLAGGIAHDFNNLLVGVFGNLSLAIEQTPPDSAVGALLANASQALARAQGLTRQLLTFSRGGAPVARPVDLEGVVRSTVRFALSGSTCRAVVTLAGTVPHVLADAAQLGQVVENLVINAEQAMAPGGTLRVHLGACELGPANPQSLAPGRYALARFTDQGPGIPPEQRVHLFEPFFTTKPGGTGLGLATAYSIAKRHGGAVTYDPDLGPGATFTIYLPAAASAPPPAAPEPVSRHRAGRILVMDDEPMVREVLGVVLPHLGHRVETVEGGAEAVAAYRRALAEGRRFDVVILDLTIPGGMGGLDTLAALRALDPEVVAVVSSGYSDDAVVADPGRFGFAAVLAKPFTVDAVSRVLAPLLAPPVAPGAPSPGR
ncbi:MAG: PAS domain S-box protein [Polyangiaceae bacterium]|nr:PAS domain S-box protein [Polyangiaceae bacterium]